MPVAHVRLYADGSDDAIVLDRGTCRYDLVGAGGRGGQVSGTISVDANKVPKLRFIPDVGLTCREYYTPRDTLLANYTPTGGSWEQRKPATGSPRPYFLTQYSAAADVVWEAESTFTFPADPSFAVVFDLADTPGDHDATTYPPYVRIEFGNAAWALEYSKVYGARLLQMVSGAWVAIADLSELSGLGNADGGELLILLRVLRGRIHVSHDRGRSYASWGNPDGTAISIPAHKITLRGQGGQVVFGLHQLQYVTGVFTSPTRNTLTSRAITATPTISGKVYEPSGTSTGFADASSPLVGTAGYTATLTPSTATGPPGWSMHRTPEVYAVFFSYPVVTLPALGYYTTPWDGEILQVEVDKPYELDGATATVTIQKDAATQFDWPYGRFPKAQLRLGELAENGTGVTWYTSFTGYIAEPRVEQQGYGQAKLTLKLENASLRLRDAQWTDFDSVPLGGQTLNAALDDILYSEAIPQYFYYRDWYFNGDVFLLPAGLAEDPFEWPQRGESKWETAQRLAGYAGLELAVRDDGTLTTVVRNSFFASIVHTFEATATGELNYGLQAMSVSRNDRESATLILVQGNDVTGAVMYAYAIDSVAELVPANGRFCAFRRIVQEEVQGTTTLGMLLSRAQ
ncbi:MAG: hypothetical protein Q7R40_00020, partial [Phaeospirillum sp.]|nr:hypothetical protein [Phaeospirillum sp.]